jgi:hypothetical protein
MWQITYSTTNLVSRHPGTLLIITCPHDGTQAPPSIPECTGQGPSGCRLNPTQKYEPKLYL